MCQGNDLNCPHFEEHYKSFVGEDLSAERRSFLKSAFVAGGGAAALMAGGMSLVTPSLARASAERRKAIPDYHYLPANAETMHWGFFSKSLAPQVEIDSRDIVTIETLTHHAGDDMERMVLGDPGAESVFEWTA
jgi:hypothetical protein